MPDPNSISQPHRQVGGGLRRKIKEVSVGGSLHYGIWARWMDVQACKLMQSFLEKADLKSEVKHFAHELKH